MDARLNAASVILQRGVRFRLPASFFKRLFKKDVVTIRHLHAGTIIEISRVILEADIESAAEMGDYEMLSKSIEPCARCIAIAILNEKHAIAKGADRLTEQLLWKVSPKSIVDLFVKISVMNRVADFMIITRYLLSQTMMMMNRKNLGHEENGG